MDPQQDKMIDTLHITNGDAAGDIIEKCGVSGEVLVWRDILYDGPRKPGWPDEKILNARARFLADPDSGNIRVREIFEGLKKQYSKLMTAGIFESIVLWFDACLFDQSMLCHILTCLRHLNINSVELICIDAFPGIVPFHGLGQLSPEQMASIYGRRRPVTEEQFRFAFEVDRAFALQDRRAFENLSTFKSAPLPWVPAAVKRWLEEIPDSTDSLGRLEQLALDAVRRGCRTPGEIFKEVSAGETPPQFWGDTTLWAKLNSLAGREPPLVRIEGPMDRLPEWDGIADLKTFSIHPTDDSPDK